MFVWSGASSQAKDDPEIDVGFVFIPCKYFSSAHTQVYVGNVARPMYLAEKREDTLLFIAEST